MGKPSTSYFIGIPVGRIPESIAVRTGLADGRSPVPRTVEAMVVQLHDG